MTRTGEGQSVLRGGPSEKKVFDKVMVDVEWHIWKELIYVLKISQGIN